jgi:hypothetical protein
MGKSDPIIATVWEDTGATCLGRFVGQDAAAITQASLTSIAYKVYNLDSATPTTATATGTLTIASVVYDTLQTSDDRWTVDSTGFNFLDTTAGAAANLATGDQRYRIEYTFTPASGEVFKGVFEPSVRAIIGS